MNSLRFILSFNVFLILGLLSDLSSNTGGSYTPKNGDVVADSRGDLLLVSIDRSSDKISLIPVAPTRSDPNVYEYASWRSREIQLGLKALVGTSLERSGKVEAQLNQSAIDRIVSVSASSSKLPLWLTGARATGSAGSNWFTSTWFGSLYLGSSSWIYHSDLGWLYTSSDGMSNLWLWHEDMGWCWTGKNIYPWLRHNETADWIFYLKTSSGKTYFFNNTSRKVDFFTKG